MDMKRESNAPLLCRVGERQPTVQTPDLLTEHAAMVRWLGQLQRRIDSLQQAHRQHVTALQAQAMHLRGQALVLRTATLWSLGSAVLAAPSSTARASVLRALHPVLCEASEVICQTGCVGHAHPWRDDQGLCRRTGEVCQPGGNADVEALGDQRSEQRGV